MNCAACERNLSAYLDDELTTDTRLDMEAHLDGCESCRSEFQAHEATWEAAGLVQAGPAPEGLWDAIAAELEPEGGATSLEDVALMVRGLAGELQDLRRTVDALRADLEESDWTEERETGEKIRVSPRPFATGRLRPGSIEQFRRSS